MKHVVLKSMIILRFDRAFRTNNNLTNALFDGILSTGKQDASFRQGTLAAARV